MFIPDSRVGTELILQDINAFSPAKKVNINPGNFHKKNSKAFWPVVYFAELVQTRFWAVWVEQHTALYNRFLPRSARKESN